MKPKPWVVVYLLTGLLVLSFLPQPLLALDPPTSVRDGTGSDIDEQLSYARYAANWGSPSWDSASSDPVNGDTVGFIIILQRRSGASWQTVPGAGGRNEVVWDGNTFPATTFSKNVTLTKGYEYRVGVQAFLYHPAGAAAEIDEKSDFAYSDGFLVLAGADAELSASPSTLQFQEGVEERPVDLTVRATGSGSITITSLSLEKTFPNAVDSGPTTEGLNLSVPAGGSRVISRSLPLSSFDRTRALGGSQTGSFTAVYRVSGTDAYGNPVAAELQIPATVSAEIPSDLQITALEVELPDSPYYAGDVISNARVRVQATGSGMVTGEILLDEESDWSEESAFSVQVEGETTFDIAGTLPTDSPGEHTVTAQITSPVELSAEANYTISDERPPFPPEVLTLVTDVAELSELQGEAVATSNESAGYEEFVFNGTAKMKLLSLDDTEIEEVTVTDLKVRYENDNPTKAKIKDGTVEKEAEGEETFVTVANDYLKIKKVFFDGNDTSRILVNAKLSIPKLKDQEIMELENLVVKTEGVEGKSFSYEESDPKSFTAFGMDFRLHDVDTVSNAVVVGKDKENDRYYFGFSGSIQMTSKKGTEEKKETITEFEDLTFFSDGDVDGTITVKETFDLVPDKMELTKIELKSEGDSWKLKFEGKLKKLPEPLDKLNGTTFKLTFDKDGNAEGNVVLVKELEKDYKGHKLGNSDDSEWDLGIGTLDLTYLEFLWKYEDGVFNKDFSELRMGVDFYLDLKTEGGEDAEDDQRRITFGELNANKDFEGGVRLNMEGDFDWHSPSNAEILQNKRLSLPGLELAMDSIAVQTQPFGLGITGSVVMGMSGVSGGVEFENLVLSVDGTISNLSDAIVGGEFEVAGSMKVEVSEIEWSTSPTSISFSRNETTGEGENQSPEKGEAQVQVNSYVRLQGAAVNLGDTDNPTMSGGFEEFTFYDPVDGGRSFVLREASLATAGVEFMADVEYSASLLTLAGSMTIPGDTIEAAIVGKFGRQEGDFTMGVFVAATGLNMPVAPGLFLDGIGGGFFINPVQADMELVRSIAGFTRPELDGEITKKRPRGEENPGMFALMLLGDFYVAEKNFIHGRALLTMTANYFNLDAEASYAVDTVKGTGYLAVGWGESSYAEGSLNLELDFVSILKGEGNLSFYVYGEETWGVVGDYNVYLYDKGSGEISTGSLFVGPPGLMVEASVSYSVDWKVLSGSLTFEGMFWYWQKPASSRFGVYAAVTARGEIMKIASGKASLEGALIASPALNIYAVGSVRLEVCGRKVWSGSMWVSAGMSGIDGSSGTNGNYDEMIEDAKTMADEMDSAKDELLDDMDAAKMELAMLSPEQMEAAGLVLVEPGSNLYGIWEEAFEETEVENWPGYLPQELVIIRSRLFGATQSELAALRSALEQEKEEVNAEFTQIEELQTAVMENFERYESLLVEELPAVQELGATGSPFGGYSTETVTVNGESKEVTVGFDLDEEKAEQQAQELYTVRESFAEYQDAFIERAGRIDYTLRELDRILYRERDENLSALTAGYGRQYRSIQTYLRGYIDLQIEQKEYAEASLSAMESVAEDGDVEPVVRELNEELLDTLSPGTIETWHNQRNNLVNALVSSGGEDPPEHPEGLSVEEIFVERGVDIWWRIPEAGFSALASGSEERLQLLQETFGENMRSFRSSWSGATVLVERIYSRKADLYALLYEIYDQLANYGTGDIGILGGGNAGGFAGNAGAGLEFRTEAAASEISAQAFSLPGGAAASGPTMGPQRPPQEDPVSSMGGAFSSFILDQQTEGGTGSMFFGGGGQGFDSGSAVESSAGTSTYIPDNAGDWKWVPVQSYFQRKSEELVPYITNPAFTLYTGGVRSETPYAAELSAQFEAVHPVEVVEYSWRLSAETEDTEVQDEQEASEGTPGIYGGFVVQPGEVEMVGNTLLQSGGGGEQEGGGGLFGLFGPAPVQMQMGLQLFIPWFSLGDEASFEDTLFPGSFESGAYGLTIRARGAGGTSIIRKGRIDLRYFDPDTDTAPVESSIDTSDSTPPARPVVQLDEGYSNRMDMLFASWSSSDPESGIARYEYAVIPYEEPEEPAEAEGPEQAGYSGPAGSFGPAGYSGQAGVVSGETSYGMALSQQAELAQSVNEDDSIPWRDAESLTEMNIRNLALDHGQRYVVAVKAVNGAGMYQTGFSAPVLVDVTTPQAAPLEKFEQSSIDGHPNSFRLEFGLPVDPESGIDDFSFALGTAEGSDNLWEWTSLDVEETDPEGPDFEDTESAYSVGIANAAVSEGQDVYLTLRGLNRAGSSSDSVHSIEVSFDDSTAPMPVELSMQPKDYTADPTRLQAAWSPSVDEESGIVKYEYGIGSSPDSPDKKWWSVVSRQEKAYLLGEEGGGPPPAVPSADRHAAGDGHAAQERYAQGLSGKKLMGERLRKSTESEAPYQVDISGLDLDHGGEYYLIVRVTNGAGLTTVSSEGPLTVDTTPPAITALYPSTTGLGRGSQGGFTFEAEDSESGIAAYKFRVFSQVGFAAGPQTIYESEWIPVSAIGTSDEVERTIASGIAAPEGAGGADAPMLRVTVMNGAGGIATATISTSADDAKGEGKTE